MKLSDKFFIILLLALIIKVNGYAQETMIRKTINDILISKNILGNFKWDLFKLRAKIKVQEYEIGVLKQLGKVNSLGYGKDSLIVLYISTTGKPLKRIVQKYMSPQTKSDRIPGYKAKFKITSYL